MRAFAQSFALILFFALAMPFAAKAEEALLIPHFSPGGSSEATSSRGVRQAVRFIVSRDDPPFVFERRGLVLGLYVDFVRELCDGMNFACVVDLIPRDEIANEFIGDRDVLLSTLPELEPRLARYALTQPILQNTARFLVLQGTSLQRGWPEDLASVRIGVINASPYQRYLEEVLLISPSAEFANLQEAIEALRAGLIDALFADSLRLNFFLNTTAGECCRLLEGAYLDARYFREKVVMAVRRNNPELRQLMSSGIANLTRNESRWGQIYLRYFPFGLY